MTLEGMVTEWQLMAAWCLPAPRFVRPLATRDRTLEICL